MRVIAGSLRGRKLAVPRAGVRPTSDRVREALFARLGALDGTRVLDLYAGSGALGIEALSRGARSAVFIDRAATSCAVLRRNLESLGLAGRSRVVRADLPLGLRRLPPGERFELVLADPPYGESEIGEALGVLVRQHRLAVDATLVVERERRHPLPAIAGLALLDERRYGDTVIARLGPRPAGRADEVEHRESE